MKMSRRPGSTGSHHLDKRADQLAERISTAVDTEKLLSTKEVAPLLGVSTQWLEIGRHRGYGPAFVRIGRRVRYRHPDLVSWLEERTHRCTSEYSTGRRRPARKTREAA
jgi:predicted DNA-binding transcriptional regulator AlpA